MSTFRTFHRLGIALVIGYSLHVSSCVWLWLGIVLIIGYSPRILRILLTRIFSWAAVHQRHLHRQRIVVVLAVVASR
jgi:hypothetical protein